MDTYSKEPGNTGKRKINIHQKSDRSGKEHKIETSLPTGAGNVPHRRSKDNVPPTQHKSLRESAKITN